MTQHNPYFYSQLKSYWGHLKDTYNMVRAEKFYDVKVLQK